MNIGIKYSAFVLAIQKNWKVEITNLAETMLQIIRYFEFIERNEKNKVVLQISTPRPPLSAPKKLYKNPEYIEKGLTTHYINCCWVKHPKLR